MFAIIRDNLLKDIIGISMSRFCSTTNDLASQVRNVGMVIAVILPIIRTASHQSLAMHSQYLRMVPTDGGNEGIVHLGQYSLACDLLKSVIDRSSAAGWQGVSKPLDHAIDKLNQRVEFFGFEIILDLRILHLLWLELGDFTTPNID